MRNQSLKAAVMMAAALGATAANDSTFTKLPNMPKPERSHYRVGKSHRLGSNLQKVKDKRKKRNRAARRRARASQRAAR